MAKKKIGKDGYYRTKVIYKGEIIDVRSRDLKELDEKIRQKKNDIDSGLVLYNADMLVSAWADQWAESYKKGYVTLKNYNTYICNLDKINSEIGNMRISDVRQIHLQQILNKYQGKSKTHLSHIKNAMTGMFGQAKINHMIVDNPAEGLKLPACATNQRRSLTTAERKLMLRVCEHHYAKTLVYIMLYAGLRPNECAALRWKHIDLDKKYIHVRTAQESGTRNEKMPKTAAGIRDIPITPPLYAHLSEIKAEPDEYVLKTATGAPCTVDRFEAWWRYLLREMDIAAGAKVERNKITETKLAPDLTLYMLRHTFCTDLQRAGVPLNIARVLMGHDDVSITAKIYTEYTDDQAEATAKIMSDYADTKQCDLDGKNSKSGSKSGSKNL